MSREMLKAAGLCPCCGEPNCSNIEETRNRLKAKLEVRRAQKSRVSIMEHKQPQTIDNQQDLDALARWIEHSESKTEKHHTRTKKKQRNWNQTQQVIRDDIDDDEIVQFSKIMTMTQHSCCRRRVLLSTEARQSLIQYCNLQLRRK
jgi:hypothetical protein